MHSTCMRVHMPAFHSFANRDRDIQALVSESGLRVVELKTKHLGTTYFIRAEPQKRDGAERSRDVVARVLRDES